MSMKKWSKKIAMLVLSFGMLIGSSVTAFAFVPDDVNSEAATETVQEEAVAETPEENTEENTKETNGDGFSVPGNGEVMDNITDDSSKEFYTITTANNNTYYLVIDHSTTSNNVYMLSSIDENDLKDFIEETEETPETTPSVIVDEKPETETPSVETEPEKAETETQTTEKGAMVAVILAALLGIGAYGYFKVYKPRQEDDDAESENMETEMFETINEDEEKTDEDSDLTDEEQE